ncbi:hypothetical protein OC709_02250 ['Planchonia careya' phytoplasma]|nr:hypothetical protein ['Planchonia careya' phytoplasma]MDO8030320.1 hypothetical protein ['Planchonia careya' phytoplasma]
MLFIPPLKLDLFAGFHDFNEGSPNRSRKVIDGEQQNNSSKMDLNSGYGGLCDRQDDPCSLASVKDIEVHLSHVTSTCLVTDIQGSDEGDIKTTVFGSGREQSEDFIVWNDNINQNFVSVASRTKKSDMGNSHSCKFTETLPVDTSGLDAQLSGKSSRSLERNDNVIEKDALISRSAKFSTNLSFTSPEVVIANDGENLSGGRSTSSASGPREAQKKSTKTGPTLESPSIHGDSVTFLDHTVTCTKKQLCPKESACATTDNTKSNRSQMKNLRLGEKMKQAAGRCLKYKDRTSTPASEPSEDLNEKKLNSISEVRTGWSEEQENILEDMSPSEAGKSSHLLTKSKGKLKDDQRNVKLLGHEENNLSSGPVDNTNTDGKWGQKCQGMMSKTAKQTKNMNCPTVFSIQLGDINQKDELKIAVGKKEANAKKESNSGSKTERKLTYVSKLFSEHLNVNYFDIDLG